MLPSLFPYGAILFAAAAPIIIPGNDAEITAPIAPSAAVPIEFTCFSRLKDVGSPFVLGSAWDSWDLVQRPRGAFLPWMGEEPVVLWVRLLVPTP